MMKAMAVDGYDGASVAKIARAADLTPGLVHYHFENKREILLAVLDELAGDHDRGLSDALANCAGPWQQIDAFIDFHVGLGANANPEALACWLVISTEALRHRGVREAFAKAVAAYTDLLTQVIQAGAERGEFGNGAPRAAASALMATIQGYFVMAATARTQIPRGSAAKCTKRMARGLLGHA